MLNPLQFLPATIWQRYEKKHQIVWWFFFFWFIDFDIFWHMGITCSEWAKSAQLHLWESPDNQMCKNGFIACPALLGVFFLITRLVCFVSFLGYLRKQGDSCFLFIRPIGIKLDDTCLSIDFAWTSVCQFWHSQLVSDCLKSLIYYSCLPKLQWILVVIIFCDNWITACIHYTLSMK